LKAGVTEVSRVTTNTELRETDGLAVGPVWAGTAASFDLYTHGEDQYVAYYDDERAVTVGQRRLGETDWTVARLPEERRVKWDAHNYLTLTVDDDGHLHLSGNMHCHPLKYWRTTEPGDVTSFERVASMVGTEEDSVTYPQFFRGPDGELLYKYRDGYSGGGNWIYNVYDPERRAWDRLLDDPVTYGGDEMNAYPVGPQLGPDGYYHLCWVWRDNGGAQMNHDLSYARSPDLREWETSRGKPRDLPMTATTGDIVDPVPPWGGMINGNTKLGFDTEDRVIVSYHKFDHEGNTQVYSARAEEHGWEIYQTSDWDYRWAFGGGGTIGFDVSIGGVEVEDDGRLTQTFEHVKYGSGKWVLDEETLEPVEWLLPHHRYPAHLRGVDSDDEHVQVNWAEDSGDADDAVYALRWESLEPSRDLGYEEEPAPTTLTLHAFERRDGR
jgi:hypothetical protein